MISKVFVTKEQVLAHNAKEFVVYHCPKHLGARDQKSHICWNTDEDPIIDCDKDCF